jgi:hypothetical protein
MALLVQILETISKLILIRSTVLCQLFEHLTLNGSSNITKGRFTLDKQVSLANVAGFHGIVELVGHYWLNGQVIKGKNMNMIYTQSWDNSVLDDERLTCTFTLR